jgi:hypothetical protein
MGFYAIVKCLRRNVADFRQNQEEGQKLQGVIGRSEIQGGFERV